ncbi:MAG: hypothetical protein OEM64_13280, partial [Gammaproteobacteria bacterium]|nr:hypothetical protein [Gammaproteobacteria bacterium]
GQVSLKQVESVLKRNLAPQSGVTTLGGWVMDRLGHLPKEGDQFEDADHKFIVTKMNGRRVDKVTISHV